MFKQCFLYSGMSTRSSARNRNKPKVDYNDDPTVTTDKPARKTRGKKAPKAADDDDDENDNNVSNTVPARKPRGRKAANKAAATTNDSDDDDSKPAKPTRGKRKAKAPTPIPEDEEMETKKKKIEEKIDTKIKEEQGGKIIVPVDSQCPVISVSTVFCDSDGPWDAMLNQTNVGSNNNKYYLLQLLKHTNQNSYYTWFRWGRIGYSNGHQNKLTPFRDLEAAKRDFMKKFSEKTKNVWPCDFEDFEKYPNKYDLIKLDYAVKEEEVEVDGAPVKQEPVESKLDPRLLSMMELISNVKAMEQAVMEMNYDVKKSPLGKLSKEQIKSGYEALTIIEECIKANESSSKKAKDACSMFYTRIPHNFGFTTPPLIRTLEEVKIKIELLDTLIDIEAAVKAIKEGTKDTVHKTDSFYQNLKIEMKPLERDSDLFQMLSTYLHNTHGKTHLHYTLEVEDIFELNKEGEEDRYKDLGNKQLLWHGSRLANWGGIFSQGLRIAPPEAPVTGYMFGKGVYFADMASKSANYCFTSHTQPTGILLLAEVSLGEERELLGSDYHADKLPAGKHSTKGVGLNAPDPAQTKSLGDVKVPLGTGVNTGVTNPGGYTLQYNEFIVYDVAQIKMKYALRVKFNYKR